jgi:hypothetical protein
MAWHFCCLSYLFLSAHAVLTSVVTVSPANQIIKGENDEKIGSGIGHRCFDDAVFC